jgi:hypothetical protein
MEVADEFLSVVRDMPGSSTIIDLTASPLPVTKQEPIESSSAIGNKGKAQMIIDLTMDSDNDN